MHYYLWLNNNIYLYFFNKCFCLYIPQSQIVELIERIGNNNYFRKISVKQKSVTAFVDSSMITYP